MKRKIALSKYAGFCDGVKRAFDIVIKTAREKRAKEPIFVLGSLVHNQEVVDKIEERGIKKIKFQGKSKFFFAYNKGKIGTIIIRAHGIGPEFYKFAKQDNINIIDATCPKVIRAQRLAKFFSEKSYQVVIIGQKEHKEVRGIFEWSGEKAKIVGSAEDADKIKFDPDKKIAIISQTTQNEELVKKISNKIKNKYPGKTRVFNTLCLTTHNRQQEVRKLAKENDILIVIGSSNSANSTHLWEIAKEINPRSYFVEGVREIKPEWFANAKKIGVSAGASTPDWIIRKVCRFLRNKL